MKLGLLDVSKFFAGTDEVNKLYLGENLVYDNSSPEEGYVKAYSGFGSGSFIRISHALPLMINSYELIFRFQYFSPSNGRVIGNLNNNIHSPQLEIPESSSDKRLWYGHPSSSNSWESLETIATVEPYTDFSLKATWENNLLQLYTSEDGENWTVDNSRQTNGCGWDEGIELGADQSTYTLPGIIDIYNSSIKFNNEYWFNGKTAVEGVDYEIVGTLTAEHRVAKHNVGLSNDFVSAESKNDFETASSSDNIGLSNDFISITVQSV